MKRTSWVLLLGLLVGLGVLATAGRAEAQFRRDGRFRGQVGVNVSTFSPYGYSTYTGYWGRWALPFQSYYQISPYGYYVAYATYAPYPAYPFYPVYVPTYYPYPAPAYQSTPYSPGSLAYASSAATGYRAGANTGRARIEVRVPDPSAEVCFEGDTTVCIGTERSYVSPEVVRGRTYTYRVTAEWVKDGQRVKEERVADVTAGKTTIVDFNKPKPPERLFDRY